MEKAALRRQYNINNKANKCESESQIAVRRLMAIQPASMPVEKDPVLMQVLQEDKMARAQMRRQQALENKKIKARESRTMYFDQDLVAKKSKKVNKSVDQTKPVAFFLDWNKYNTDAKP